MSADYLSEPSRSLQAGVRGLAEALGRARGRAEADVQAALQGPPPPPEGWEDAPPELQAYVRAMTGGAALHPPDAAVEALWGALNSEEAAAAAAASAAARPGSPWVLRAAGLVAAGLGLGAAPPLSELAAARLARGRSAAAEAPAPAPAPAAAEAAQATRGGVDGADGQAAVLAGEALARWEDFSRAMSSRALPTEGGFAIRTAPEPEAQPTGGGELGRERVEVYATHLTNDDYVVGALVLASSLLATGTTRPLVALVTQGVSGEGRKALRQGGWALVDVELVGLAGADTLHARSFLSKVWLWALPADAVIYLDTDMLVLDSLDALFQLCGGAGGGAALAAVPDSQPHASGGEPMVQGGLLVLRPSSRRFSDMYARCTGASRPKSLDDWAWHDQEFLTEYFGEPSQPGWRQLPARFNFCVRYHLRPLYSGLTPATASVLHFATAKPWDPDKRHHVLPPYVRLYLAFAQAARVPWRPVCVAADEARDEEDRVKLAEMTAAQ